jgi:hypothetical protein
MMDIGGLCRLTAAVIAVVAAVGLTGCLARSPSYTFEEMPATCDELTREFRQALFTDSTVLEPDAEMAGGGRTRFISCGVSADHAELARPADLRVTVVQVAVGLREVGGMPTDQWLHDEVTDQLAGQATIAQSCEPEQIEAAGADFAMMCVYDTEGAFVAALVSAADTDTRVQVSSLVELTRDRDEDLSELLGVAEEVARAIVVTVLAG